MGGRHSRHYFNPPKVDPMFIDIGCIGLKKDDFSGSYNQFNSLKIPNDSILTECPFLYVPFFATSYENIQQKIQLTFDLVSQGIETPTNKPNKTVLYNLSLITSGSSSQSVLNYILSDLRPKSNPIPATSSQSKTMPASPASSPSPAPSEVVTSSDDGVDVTMEGFANPMSRIINGVRQNIHGKQQSPPQQIVQHNGPIYGPVFFIIAKDFTFQNTYEGYIYFPSMYVTKNDNGIITKIGRYRNYIELGTAHRWMHTLLYSRTFYRRPVALESGKREWTRCEMYNGRDPLKYGCRTDATHSDKNIANACKETEDILRDQGTFKTGDGYNPNTKIDYGTDYIPADKNYYPSSYFHSYQIDTFTSKSKFLSYINQNSFTSLQLNVMLSDMEYYPGCAYMLISPNYRMTFSLNKDNIALGFNTKNIDLLKQCFEFPNFANALLPLKKYNLTGIPSRFIIENGVFNVYTLDTDGGVESVNLSIQVIDKKYLDDLKAKSKPQGQYALVLDNNGVFKAYDYNDKDVTSLGFTKSFVYSYSPNGNAEEIAANNTPSSLKYPGYGNDSCYIPNQPFNADKNYRCRMLNLMAYLRLKGLLIDVIKSDSSVQGNQAFKIIYQVVDKYNSTEDYVKRIIDLINFLESHYNIQIDHSIVNDYIERINNPFVNPDGNNAPSNGPSASGSSSSTYNVNALYQNNNQLKFDQNIDIRERLSGLKQYLSSYNLLNIPLYDINALNSQGQSLPLLSNINGTPSSIMSTTGSSPVSQGQDAIATTFSYL